jgi:hypothetical protein
LYVIYLLKTYFVNISGVHKSIRLFALLSWIIKEMQASRDHSSYILWNT